MPESTEPLVAGFTRIMESALDVLPELLAAIILLIAGWALARLLRALTIRSAAVVNRSLSVISVRFRSSFGGLNDSTIRVIAGVVFWSVFLIFLASAATVLGLTFFSGWLDRLVAFLPQVISGALIIFAGVIVANIARDAVLATGGSLSELQREVLGRATQVATLLVLTIVGVDQIGIDITVIIIVIAVVLACLLGGLSIAFSLGARRHVSNLIGAHYLSKDFREGERVRINDVEGDILEITPVSVVLETEEGRLNVPAHLFSEHAVLLLVKGPDHG